MTQHLPVKSELTDFFLQQCTVHSCHHNETNWSHQKLSLPCLTIPHLNHARASPASAQHHRPNPHYVRSSSAPLLPIPTPVNSSQAAAIRTHPNKHGRLVNPRLVFPYLRLDDKADDSSDSEQEDDVDERRNPVDSNASSNSKSLRSGLVNQSGELTLLCLPATSCLFRQSILDGKYELAGHFLPTCVMLHIRYRAEVGYPFLPCCACEWWCG